MISIARGCFCSSLQSARPGRTPGQTLQATALVHEAYVRLVDGKKARHWDSRGHFLAAAETHDRVVDADGTVLAENRPHRELYAFRDDNLVSIPLTDTFGSIGYLSGPQPSTGAWSTTTSPFRQKWAGLKSTRVSPP